MVDFAKELLVVSLENEMRQSYLDYAMSVIVGRALPDVRDGLKPVHRRVLFAMRELSNDWNKPYKKSARIVGDVIGKYHPHGDVAVYDTIVRMAQPFSMRYMLVDGQGNFGCFTGDTKIKLVDGSDKTFAELAALPSEQVFYVYAVDAVGKIVIAEGRNSRITRRQAQLLEVTLDNGATIRCTPDHLFMLRDGSYKQAKELTIDDSLMPGYFDSVPIKPGLNEYLRIFQPTLGEYQFVHHLADEFNAKHGVATEFHSPFVRHHRNFNRWLQLFPEQDITPELYEANRHQNWIPHLDKALTYFNGWEELQTAGKNYNHRIVSIKHLQEVADTYDITVDEYHNFLLACGVFVHNSVDGDSPAAMRYTEIRLARIAHEVLADLDQETVTFVPNYDETEQEPTVLPTRIPNLLINGSTGIAVGMATNIPPHNLSEVITACLALIDNPDISLAALMRYLPGPDFPTAAIINGAEGIRDAYATGRGRIILRAKAHVEPDPNHNREIIIVEELPYQVNKAKLLERIGELVREKKLEGISETRDESDKDGLRVVIELKRGEMGEVVLNNLYQHTQLQIAFGINMVAIVHGQPQTLNLIQVLQHFLRHRQDTIIKRTLFQLRKAKERVHLLEGLAVALVNLDAVIEIVKTAPSPAVARDGLLARIWPPGMVAGLLARSGIESSRPDNLSSDYGLLADGYRLSEAQAQAILDLRLHRLTGLEQDKIVKEFEEILETINSLLYILSSPDHLMAVIRTELEAIRTQYGDARRTEIMGVQHDLVTEDLITPEAVVVTLSNQGYVKAQPVSQYQAQRRGGKGKIATTTKDEDFIDKLFIANTLDTILCFSSRGKVYWLKVYELPQAGRNARGRPIINLLPLEPEERINAVLPIHEYQAGIFVFMVTSSGTVKKTPLEDFSRPLARGIKAVELREDEQLIGVALTDGQREVMLFTSDGKAIRFKESEVRSMSRTAHGVRGIRVHENAQVIALIIAGTGTILMATANGYGKRTIVDEFTAHGRGGQGVICILTNERNGPQIGAVLVQDSDEIMLISDGGTLVRTTVANISLVGRRTQGVKLISLAEGEKLVGLDRIESITNNDSDSNVTALEDDKENDKENAES